MAKNNKGVFNDLGLVTKSSARGFRSLNKDGTFNVKKTNLSFFEQFNFFHVLISMSWLKFFGVIISGYFVVNSIFAYIYVLIGVENLTGVEKSSEFNNFIEAFFFSAQTITTLGYGRVAPLGLTANIVAAIESMLGLLSFALATGLLYGRFSKPSAKIKYSTHAVIAPYQDINAFMFRVANPRSNQLLEVEVNITLSMKRKDSGLRDFFILEVERPKVVFFPYTWTIVHPINKESPLYNMSADDVKEKDAEFIVMMKAFDESFSQTVYSRSSYNAFEIKWGEKFVYAMKHQGDEVWVDMSKLGETEEALLNG